MRKFLVVIALLLVGSGVVWADTSGTGIQGATNQMLVRTKTVFNNSGSNLTSGTVVVWDNDKSSFDRTGYPYVTTTTTADSPWTAGVTLDGTCNDQTLCEIVTYGWAWVRTANSTDAIAEDTLAGTTTIAGKIGDYSPAANSCALGMVTENYNKESLGTCSTDNCVFPVFVEISCQ